MTDMNKSVMNNCRYVILDMKNRCCGLFVQDVSFNGFYDHLADGRLVNY
jgi:hypothetical protein